ITAFHSSTDMLKKKRSRRMPALLTTTSILPKASMAVLTMRFAASHSATLSVFATAVPPFALISATTFCAGPASLPSPATDAPMSLTTTLAPCAAMACAKSRPMPPPAPVTTTTLSLSISILVTWVPAIEHAQHGWPLEFGDLAALPGLVAVVRDPHCFRSRVVELGVAGHRHDLRLAGLFQPVHGDKGVADRAARREQPVVAQDQRGAGTEIAYQTLLLVQVHRRAFVVVVADFAEEHRVLRQGQQAAFERRNRHAGGRMRMDYAIHVMARPVDRAVNDEAGEVGAVSRAGIEHDLAVE